MSEDDNLQDALKPRAAPRPSRGWDVPANGKKAFVHQWNPLKWSRPPPKKTDDDTAACGDKLKGGTKQPLGPAEASRNPPTDGEQVCAQAEGSSSVLPVKETHSDTQDNETRVSMTTVSSVLPTEASNNDRSRKSKKAHRDIILDILLDRYQWSSPTRAPSPTQKPAFKVKLPLRPPKIKARRPCADKEGTYACLLRACGSGN